MAPLTTPPPYLRVVSLWCQGSPRIINNIEVWRNDLEFSLVEAFGARIFHSRFSCPPWLVAAFFPFRIGLVLANTLYHRAYVCCQLFLTGTIPSELGQLSALLQLNLSENKLSGKYEGSIFRHEAGVSAPRLTALERALTDML